MRWWDDCDGQRRLAGCREADGHEAGCREADGHEAGCREADGHEAGCHEADGHEADGHEAGCHEAGYRVGGARAADSSEGAYRDSSAEREAETSSRTRRAPCSCLGLITWGSHNGGILEPGVTRRHSRAWGDARGGPQRMSQGLSQ